MTNIIKAGSTVSGLTVSPDQSGALEIRTGMLAGGTPALTIDTSQNVALAANATVAGNLTVTGTVTGAAGLGVGQTWQNVKLSRALGTTYTNSTGKPISVMVGIVNAAQVSWTVDGVLIGTNGDSGGYNNVITFIVPAGATYTGTTVSGTPSVQTWVELR